MFAQVACLVCGKSFQVPREKLGRSVTCSWCGKQTEAVPVAVDVQPLPASENLTPRPPLRSGEGEKTRRSRPLLWVAYAGLLLVIAGGVFVVLRMFGGGEWTEFFAPDGSCRAVLPGSPREVPAGPTDELFPSGKRFVVSPGWNNKIGGEVGWFDLPADDAKLIRPEDLFRTLRDRRADELGATPEGEGVVRVDSLNGIEVRFVKGNVRHVERYLFDQKSSRPRVYWVSAGGTNFDPESAAAKKAMGSLRVNAP